VGVFLAGLLAGLDPIRAATAANEAAAAFVARVRGVHG
jgi:sugar/nucleoside kinase (ribokinase family)